jgi:hypothetical protein
MTPIDRWRDELLRTVADARSLERLRRVQLKDGTPALQGRLRVAERVVTVALVVEPLFENKLPIVLLQPWDAASTGAASRKRLGRTALAVSRSFGP